MRQADSGRIKQLDSKRWSESGMQKPLERHRCRGEKILIYFKLIGVLVFVFEIQSHEKNDRHYGIIIRFRKLILKCLPPFR
jgi:hypothetical protein